MNHRKYQMFPQVPRMKGRTWPEKVCTEAPRWCSVDLRDGNQALPKPMDLEQKVEMFRLLVRTGFKEIEVGFPSASEVEFNFVRHLIEKNLIPEDVSIQVLTQAREHLIRKTCESLVGAKRAVIHLYNSTSELQRRVVFGMDRTQVKDIAVQGTKLVKKYVREHLGNTEIFFEYSPESFMGTEPDYALEICEAVVEAWGTRGEKVIINLPSTVEVTTPNIWADQIERFCRDFRYRKRAIISVHCHNDRGTAVAATELSILAGADRVEGTLFGNGERTGNVDLITLALNLHTQGVDSKLDFSNLNAIRETYERCTGIPVHERHPYSGELVFTAFSGSHQDAINKGMRALQEHGKRDERWEVPYMPIDPRDIGREYEPIIRINSQSGKGGVAFIMEQEFGFRLPKKMHPEFGAFVQKISDRTGQEVAPEAIWEAFSAEYLERKAPYELESYEISGHESLKSTPHTTLSIRLRTPEGIAVIAGEGNGPINAFVNAWKERGIAVNVLAYEEHALEKGADARAVAYVQLEDTRGKSLFGVGVDENIVTASFKAIVGAINRLAGDEKNLKHARIKKESAKARSH